MKALVSTAVGGPDTLQLVDLPTPTPGKGQMLVRVIACGINFPDVIIIEDKYQFKPPRPFAPGSEISGEVLALGDGVANFAVGDRIICATGWGGLSQEILIDADKAYLLPIGADTAEGAGLIMTYGTNMHGLIDRGGLKSGETLLVLGAAGGIGLAAVEIGKALGARVIGAVSSEEKRAAVMAAGADDCIIYGAAPFDKEQSKALAAAFKAAVGPKGADVIYDPVGGDYAEPALRSIVWEGRYCVVGFPAGIPKLPLNLTLLKSCDVRGVFWGAFAAQFPEKNAAHMRHLIELWQAGKVKPRIEKIWPLDQGGDAIQYLADRKAIGKVVVRVGED
jgi:NADPH:quinone reductase